MEPNQIDDEELKRYLEAKMGPQFYEQPEAIRSSNEAIQGSQESANLANMAKGFEQASASFSGGRYKPNTEYLDDFGKTAQGMAGNAEKRLVAGQKQAGDDRKLAVNEYLAGKKQTENLAFQNERLKADDKFRTDTLAANVKDREDRRTQAAQVHQDYVDSKTTAVSDKKALADAALAVPGFDMTGEVRPGPVEAKDAREALATHKDLSQDLGELRNLIKDNGSFEWGGEAATKMGSLAVSIRLHLKKMAVLGVLSKTDYALLDKQVNDPTEFKRMFSRDDSALTQIDQLTDQAKRKLSNGMASKGYRPDEAMAKTLEPVPAGASGSWGEATATDEKTRDIGGVKYEKVEGGWKKIP